jgi:hypothetical protein
MHTKQIQYKYNRASVLRQLLSNRRGVQEVTIPVELPPLPGLKNFDGFIDNTCLEEVSSVCTWLIVTTRCAIDTAPAIIVHQW